MSRPSELGWPRETYGPLGVVCIAGCLARCCSRSRWSCCSDGWHLLEPWAQEQVLVQRGEGGLERALVLEGVMGQKEPRLILDHTPSFVSTKRQQLTWNMYMWINIYMNIYVRVCVCARACARVCMNLGWKMRYKLTGYHWIFICKVTCATP